MRFIAAVREELYIQFFRPLCLQREKARCASAHSADAFFSDGFLKINLPRGGNAQGERRRGEFSSENGTL